MPQSPSGAAHGSAQRLNMLVSWHYLDDGRLQLRFPDGDHLTFDAHRDTIVATVEALAAGEAAPDGPVAHELVALLAERRMFVATPTADWLVDAIDYVVSLSDDGRGQTAKGRSPIVRARQTRLVIDGVGWLADRVRAAAGQAGLDVADAAGDIAGAGGGPRLLVAVADMIAYDHFSRVNADAVASGTPVMFLWREVARLVMGPLVLPGETACFECYRTRVRANMAFIGEFDALARWTPDSRRPQSSAVSNGLAETLIARTLLFAAAQAWDLFEPGTIHSFDALSLETQRQPVLKVARCPVCSPHAARPARSIRAIA